MIKKRAKAFTFVELIFAMVITVVVISIAAQLTMTLNKDVKILISYLGSYMKGREAIDIISKDCRMGIRVMDSYSGYTTADNCLVLKVPSIDASGNIVDINKYYDYIVYRIYNGDLCKVVLPGSQSARAAFNGVLKKSVQSMLITFGSIPLSSVAHKSTITRVTMWLSISETILGKIYQVSPGTTVKLMNYEWEYVR